MGTALRTGDRDERGDQAERFEFRGILGQVYETEGNAYIDCLSETSALTNLAPIPEAVDHHLCRTEYPDPHALDFHEMARIFIQSEKGRWKGRFSRKNENGGGANGRRSGYDGHPGHG